MKYAPLIIIGIIALIVWIWGSIALIRAYHRGWKRVDTQRKFNEDVEDEDDDQ